MIKPEKEAKLMTLFQVIPEGALRQLRQAFVFGADTDPSGMPYERLLWLLEDAANTRKIDLEIAASSPEASDGAADIEDQPADDYVDLIEDLATDDDGEAEPAVAEVTPTDFAEDEEAAHASDRNVPERAVLEGAVSEAAAPDVINQEVPDRRIDESEIRDAPLQKEGVQKEGAQDEGTHEEVAAAGPEAETPEEIAAPSFEPPRNAMHAFFLPFAPLIIDPVKYLPRVDGYICSTSLPAIWRLLNEETSGAVIRDAWVKAELVSEPQEPEFYQQITTEMHAAARVVMDGFTTKSREDPAWRRTLTSRLGSNAVLDDFSEFQVLLPFASNFREIFENITPNIDRFEEADITRIAEAIVAADDISNSLPGYLQLAVLARLQEPWLGLRLYTALRDAEMNSRRGKAETTLIADHLIAILDAESLWLEQKCVRETIEPGLFEALEGFARLLGGMTCEIEEAKQPTLSKRLVPSATRGGQIFAQMMKQSLARLHKVLPLDVSDGQDEGQEGLSPDIGWLGREAGTDVLIEQAEQAAMLLTSADETAITLNKLPLLRRSRKRAKEELSGYADQLIPMISRASGDKRLHAMRLSEHVIRLSRQILGDKEADRLKAAAEEAARAA